CGYKIDTILHHSRSRSLTTYPTKECGKARNHNRKNGNSVRTFTQGSERGS
ncbi:1948_t:CDS:1, partial [Gigaspora rosea]